MPYPKIYDSSGNFKAILSNIINDEANIFRRINADYMLYFSASSNELKSEYIVANAIVKASDQTFDIKDIDIDSNNQGIDIYICECEHVSYRLIDGEDNEYGQYTFNGTPSEILTDILTGTDFTAVNLVECYYVLDVH